MHSGIAGLTGVMIFNLTTYIMTDPEPNDDVERDSSMLDDCSKPGSGYRGVDTDQQKTDGTRRSHTAI